MSDYWKDCINDALSEIGIGASDSQVKELAEWVEGAHENYGMAHGHHCIPNPLKEENEKLQKALRKEQEKVICTYCNNTGRLVENGPGGRSSNSQCFKCNGEGFIYTR